MLKKKRMVGLVLALALLMGTVTPCLAAPTGIGKATAPSGGPRYTESSISSWVNESRVDGAWKLDWSAAMIDSKAATVTGGAIKLEPKATLSFDVPVTKAGKYEIVVRYRPENALYMSCLLDMTVNGKDYVSTLPLLWADSDSIYGTDRRGNEMVPEQIAIDELYLGVLDNYRDTDMETLVLEFKEGTQKITLSPQSQTMVIADIYVNEVKELKTYKEYTAAIGDKADATECLTLEAVHFMVKSDSFIRGTSVRNAALRPYDTYRKLINVLEGGSWRSPGQKVLWEFEVKEDGYYEFGFRYQQNADTNKPVYRSIEIDGEIPFAEWETVAFYNTATNKYGNTVLEIDGKPAKVYLTAGKHTIAMEVTLGPLEEVYDDIVILMEDINAFGMDIQKLTAGQVDQNRTWNMDYYMPNAIGDIEKFAERVDALYARLQEISGHDPSYANSLLYAAEQLRRLLEKPNQIPNRTDMISQGDNAATKYLGNVLANLNSMPISVDCLYIGNCDNLPAPNANFFVDAWEGIKAFVWSFSADAAEGNYTATGAGKSQELTVWINRSVPYVQVLQQIIDADYNMTRNSAVQLSIMPSEQKLVLANATKTNPDVVLSAASSTPFNFAVRGAVKNLNEYSDFLTFYNKHYNLEALVPATYNGGVYGAAETQDFHVLFYRKDILQALNLQVPDTWDDVKYLMPTLLRYNMNFYTPLSISTSYKGFNATNPFVTQNGGSFVSDDGLTSEFSSDGFLDAMTEMTELYEIYGMSSAVPSFYNSFRYGEIPMGIATFGTYIQLQMAAPELAGKWGIALAPGTKQEDGSILRYQPAASSFCMVFGNTQRADQAWDFLKWWLSTDTQVRYAYNMQGTYGTEYRWNTANLDAFKQMSYSREDIEIILEQWEHQKEITYHPANYMIEREASDVWNGVVVDHGSLVEEIDRATLITNRELIRKLAEFGFCDENGNMLDGKHYSMQGRQELEKLLAEAQKREGEAK